MYETIEFRGISLTVQIYYEPEEIQTHTSEGLPERIETEKVFYQGQDITELIISLGHIEEIDVEIRNKIKKYRLNNN